MHDTCIPSPSICFFPYFRLFALHLSSWSFKLFLVSLEGLSYQESNCTFQLWGSHKNNKKKILTHNLEANVDENSTMPRMRDPKPKKWNAILSCHGTGSMIANKNVKAVSKITMDLHWFHMLLHKFMLQYLCTCITYAKTQAMTAPFLLSKGKATPPLSSRQCCSLQHWTSREGRGGGAATSFQDIS